MHFKRQPQIELLNLLINYQICNNSQTGMHNNFISSWRVKTAWTLRMERGPEENQTHELNAKAVSDFEICAQSLNYFNTFLHYFP